MPPRVLLVEDSPVYRKMISDYLRSWSFEVVIAQDAEQALPILAQTEAPSLVLLDWVLPKMDGAALCRRIRTMRTVGAYTYIILLTGKDAPEDLVQGMDAGADDYIVKPFHSLELRARLSAGQRILDLQRELVRARDSMQHAATHDSLTGIHNRGEILRLLENERQRAKRESRKVGVILLDVDHFKSVNDTLGHRGGDDILKEVARRIRRKLRVYDGLGRYGGEEFLIVLSNCDLTTTLIRAEEIREYLQSTPMRVGQQQIQVTASLGVAISDGTEPEIGTVLELADASLYEAKRSGRNRVRAQEQSQIARTLQVGV